MFVMEKACNTLGPLQATVEAHHISFALQTPTHEQVRRQWRWAYRPAELSQLFPHAGPEGEEARCESDSSPRSYQGGRSAQAGRQDQEADYRSH